MKRIQKNNVLSWRVKNVDMKKEVGGITDMKCIRLNMYFAIGVFLGMVFLVVLNGFAQDEVAYPERNPSSSDVQVVLTVSSAVSIAFMISVLILKITAFIIGYKIAKLGYETLIKGITGELDFGFSSGTMISTKLKSASPGTFFVLLGAAIIAWGLFISKPFELEIKSRSSQHIEENIEQKKPQPIKTPVPKDNLPGLK